MMFIWNKEYLSEFDEVSNLFKHILRGIFTFKTLITLIKVRAGKLTFTKVFQPIYTGG